jgi:hypothetical protein
MGKSRPDPVNNWKALEYRHRLPCFNQANQRRFGVSLGDACMHETTSPRAFADAIIDVDAY